MANLLTRNFRMCGFFQFLWAVSITLAPVGCNTQKSEPECIEPPKSNPQKVVVQRRLPIQPPDPEKQKRDWCRTCVMGPEGWASCQVAFGETDDEPRDLIKKRSRERACLDSGFKEGECPDNRVVAVTCKGEETPKGHDETAKALQKAFFSKRAQDDKPAEAKDGKKP